jgi:hypothetical protein
MIRAIAALALVGTCVGLGVVSAPKASADELGSWRAGGPGIVRPVVSSERVVNVSHAGQRLRVAFSISQGAMFVLDEPQEPQEPQDGLLRINLGYNYRIVPLDAINVDLNISTNARSFRDPVVAGQVVISGASGELRVPMSIQATQIPALTLRGFGEPSAPTPVGQYQNWRQGSVFSNASIKAGESPLVRLDLRTRAGRLIRVPLGRVEVGGPSTYRTFVLTP